MKCSGRLLPALLTKISSREIFLRIFLNSSLSVTSQTKALLDPLVFGLIVSIVLMAVAANLISSWIKKYKWIAWLGLLAILAVAIDLIYTDVNILFL